MEMVAVGNQVYDPSKGEKDADPVMKEAQLLSNILNRIVRNAFYTAQKCTSGKIPMGEVSEDVLRDCQMTILNYERSMASQNLHQTFGNAEKMIRRANKWWSKISRSIDWENPSDEVHQPLIDLFHYVRVATVLMHPIAPTGAERVLTFLNMDEQFWSWEHIFEPIHFFDSSFFIPGLLFIPGLFSSPFLN